MSNPIEDLKGEAAHESSGRFTLDPLTFWEKACKLRLPDPYHYLRCLMRGLILGGSSRVEMEVDADDVVLRCDGPLPTPSLLDGLMGHLFGHSGSRLQQLAMGIQTAWNLPYATVDVVSPEGGRRFWPRKPYPTPIDGGGRESYIHLKRQRGWNVVERWLKKNYAECQAVTGECGWNSVRIRVNGKELPPGQRPPAESRYGGGLPTNLELPEAAELPIRAVVGLTIPLTILLFPPTFTFGQLHWVVGGVLVETTALPECHGLSGVVSVDCLPLDASQAKLHRGQEFESVREAVRWCWLERLLRRGDRQEMKQALISLEAGGLSGQGLRERLRQEPLWPQAPALDDAGPMELISLDTILKASRRIMCPPSAPVFRSAVQSGDVLLVTLDSDLSGILKARGLSGQWNTGALSWRREQLNFADLTPWSVPKGQPAIEFSGSLLALSVDPKAGLRAHSTHGPDLLFHLAKGRVDLGTAFAYYRQAAYYAWGDKDALQFALVGTAGQLMLLCSQPKVSVLSLEAFRTLCLKLCYLPVLLGLSEVWLDGSLTAHLDSEGVPVTLFAGRDRV